MAFYLFPYSMYQRFISVSGLKIVPNSLSNKASIYNDLLETKSGFAFLLQYLPGTHAYKARQQFSIELGNYIKKFKNQSKLSKWTSLALSTYFIPFAFFNEARDNFRRFSSRSYPQINLSNLESAFSLIYMGVIFLGLVFNIPGYIFLSALAASPIFAIENAFNHLPIVAQINSKSKRYWMRTLLNPVELVSNALNTLQICFHALAGIGSNNNTQGQKDGPVRHGIKVALNLIFGSAFFITNLVKRLVDVIEYPIIGLFEHFKSSLDRSQAKQNTLTATVDQLRTAKLLQQAAKGQALNLSNTKLKSSVSYSGYSKIDIYHNKNRLPDDLLINIKPKGSIGRYGKFFKEPLQKLQLIELVRKYNLREENFSKDANHLLNEKAVTEAKARLKI